MDKLGGPSGFINEEHQGIYEATKHLPGWQNPGDSMKLYEAAYFSGSVILEVGCLAGGRLQSNFTGPWRANATTAGRHLSSTESIRI